MKTLLPLPRNEKERNRHIRNGFVVMGALLVFIGACLAKILL